MMAKPLPSMADSAPASGALDGLRVLDLAHLLPGEFAAMWLGDLGADIIKVEAPQVVSDRQLAIPRDPATPYRAALNRNKRSLTLNLKDPPGLELLEQLVVTADVLLEGFRPGVMDRLGAGYHVLQAINPKLVYCSISGFGQDGPYRLRPGHDSNYMALAGLLGLNRGNDGQPHLLPIQLADVGGGAIPAVIAILAALIARERTGRGQYIDVSMLDGALAWTYFLLPLSHNPALADVGIGTGMLTGEALCYNVYETKDGRYLSVAALEPKFWRTLCEAIQRPDLLPHALNTGEGSAQRLADLRALFKTRALAEWLSLLDPEETCIAPLLSFDEAMNDPQIVHRGQLFTDNFGLPHACFPARLSDTPVSTRRSAPHPGQHTQEILLELGLDRTEVARLRAEGIV
jgi:alpha-methylacyl-CoA racemase